ncbi:MAG: uroporphyrinogen decarboxylase family protein [Spirochaetia bacterium]
MTKRERVERSLAGQDVDRPPVSFWYHFGTQHQGGEVIADLSIRFAEYYDLDFLKVMNDYYYPMPDGLLEVKDRDGLQKLEQFDIHASDWAEQLKAVDTIARHFDGQLHFLDTVFEPWQCLQRNVCGEHLMELTEREPDALLEALDIVTDNVLAYCKASLSAGASGIFMSTFGARKQLPYETYMKFAYPFVERIFEEIKDLGMMNTAHVHDHGIYTEDVVELPVQCISYEDTDPSNPSMAEMRNVFAGTIMSGLDKDRVVAVTPAEAVRNAERGIENGDSTRFLLAPGCSFPTWLYPAVGRMIVDTAKRAAE